jgi:hypothetical protein
MTMPSMTAAVCSGDEPDLVLIRIIRLVLPEVEKG